MKTQSVMTETILLFDGNSAEPLDALEDRPNRLRGSMLLWVDLPGASPDDVRRIASEFGLDDESVDRLIDPSDGASFRDKGAYIHVTASAPDATRTTSRTRSNVSSATTGS